MDSKRTAVPLFCVCDSHIAEQDVFRVPPKVHLSLVDQSWYSGKNHLVISLGVSGFIFTFKSPKIIVYV